MYLSDLALTDFRSYEQVLLRLKPGVTTFVGNNGQGKTNIVEAIGYLATLSSHRVAADAALVRQGAQAAVVQARVMHGSAPTTLQVEIYAGRANRARINRGQVRPAQILGIVRTVVFAPEDIELVRGDPAARRSFLDSIMVQLHPRMAGVKSEYEKVLRQRSALLKSVARGRGGSFDAGALDVWDVQLARLGAQLTAARAGIISRLRPFVRDFYREVSGGDAEARIDYRASASRGVFELPGPEELAGAGGLPAGPAGLLAGVEELAGSEDSAGREARESDAGGGAGGEGAGQGPGGEGASGSAGAGTGQRPDAGAAGGVGREASAGDGDPGADGAGENGVGGAGMSTGDGTEAGDIEIGGAGMTAGDAAVVGAELRAGDAKASGAPANAEAGPASAARRVAGHEAELMDADLTEVRLVAAMADRREAEIARGVNLVGPHRDELVLSLGTLPAKGYASHGESWSYALALKLAAWEVLRTEPSGQWAGEAEPILILDDVFAELDSRRRERLAEIVGRAGQVFVTAAVAGDVPEGLDGAVFRVAGGSITPEGGSAAEEESPGPAVRGDDGAATKPAATDVTATDADATDVPADEATVAANREANPAASSHPPAGESPDRESQDRGGDA